MDINDCEPFHEIFYRIFSSHVSEKISFDVFSYGVKEWKYAKFIEAQ